MDSVAEGIGAAAGPGRVERSASLTASLTRNLITLSLMLDQKDEPMKRREFLSNVAAGAAALGVAGSATRPPGAGSAPKKTLMMKAGHQHDHSAATLQALAAFGVNHICS